MTVDEIAGRVGEATSKITQTAILAGTASNKSTADGLHIGGMAILGALQPAAMLVSSSPGHLSPEVLVFTAILAARMQVGIAEDGTTAVEFGPHIILEALDACEKVFGKSIDS